jgi:hypothetical protein
MSIPLSDFIKSFFRENFSVIREINKKYATPRVKMTKLVSTSMFLLRLYLLFLVAILFYKFWTMLK